MRLAAGIFAAATVFAVLVLAGALRITHSAPAPAAIALQLPASSHVSPAQASGKARHAVRRNVEMSRLARYGARRPRKERP